MLTFICILGTVLFVCGLAASSKTVRIICGILAFIFILCLVQTCDDYENEERQRIERQEDAVRKIREQKERYKNLGSSSEYLSNRQNVA